jgi:hypothetical protein
LEELMPRKKEPEYFVARSSGVVKVNGHKETYVAGKTIVHRDTALYKAAPDRFVPVERPEVEQATAAPGEHR